MPPALTVAVPTCNGARHLGQALQSILAQREVDFDLIVSDDRSDDETLDLVREVAGDRARVEVNSERLGLAGNWDRCVERSRTDWVAIFHQDDVMRPGHLKAHETAIAEAARLGLRLGLVASDSTVIDDQGREVPSRIVEWGGLPGIADFRKTSTADRALFEPDELSPGLAVENPFRCSAVTTARAAHREIGGFDPTYRYVVDWHFWARVARAWAVAWELGPPTVAVRWHPRSETQRFKHGTADLDEEHQLIRHLRSALDVPPDAARAIARQGDRRMARAYLNRAYEAAGMGDRTLERRALRTALRLHPPILGRLLVDPRLLARLALGPWGRRDRAAAHAPDEPFPPRPEVE